MTRDYDDSIDVNLRSIDEIGRRIIVLGAVLTRVGLETNAPVGGDAEDIEEAESERYDLLAWLKSEQIDPEMSRAEANLLQAIVGAVPFDVVAEASWQAERLIVLAWATSLVESLPPMHSEANLSVVLAQIPTSWDATTEFIASLTVRSDEEIAQELERSEIWLWRAETEEVRRGATRTQLTEIAETITEVVAEGVEAGLIDRAPDGDFLVNGHSFHRLAEEARTKIATIASERLRALNWLRGAEDDWDNLSTDV